MIKRLRWKFEYTDGTAPRVGAWDVPGDKTTNPQFAKRENLARVVIEAKFPSGNIKPIVDCSGQDFCLIKYIAGYYVFAKQTKMLGIALVTRDFEVQCLYTQDEPIILKRSEDEKKLNYVSFGR